MRCLVWLAIACAACASCAADTDTESLADEEGPGAFEEGGSEEQSSEEGADDALEAAEDGDLSKMVLVEPGKTDDAELVKTLPIAKSESAATRRVVMRIGPGELPSLAVGDRLTAAAEAEVTTRCDV